MVLEKRPIALQNFDKDGQGRKENGGKRKNISIYTLIIIYIYVYKGQFIVDARIHAGFGCPKRCPRLGK